MTTYFDDVAREIETARRLHAKGELSTWDLVQKFDAIEQKVVWDCTIASSGTKFPEDLRLFVNRAVLRYGVQTLPSNAVPADFKTENEHARRLHDLGSALHDVFHEVARRDILGYTDTPTTVIRSEWFTPREEERGKLAATEFGGEDPEAYIKRILADPP